MPGRSRTLLAPLAAAGLLTGLLVSTQPLRPVAAAAPSFGHNVVLTSSTGAIADTEPSIRVAPDGTIYVGAIHGVPSGMEMWKSTDGGGSFTTLGSPDAVVPQKVNSANLCCAAVGGGDMDFAVNADGTIGASSLWLGSTSVGRSTDGGATFVMQPYGSDVPVVDREWNTTDGQTMYMSFHDLATGNIDVVKSPAGPAVGLAYEPAGLVFSQGDPALNNNAIGNLLADPHHPNLLYQVFAGPGAGGKLDVLTMAVSQDGGSTWTQHVIYRGPSEASYASVFPAAALDDAGNVYAVVSDNTSVDVFSSVDQGATWSEPKRVNSIPGAAGFPWIAAGGHGGVVVTWFGGTDAHLDRNSNQWKVYAAESTDATDSVARTGRSPHYTLLTVSDHVVHRGSLCEQGLGCSSGRQLGDFFQVAVGPDGFADVAWSDDHTGTATVNFAHGGINLGRTHPSLARPAAAPATEPVPSIPGTAGACGWSDAPVAAERECAWRSGVWVNHRF